jgi:hypothetical protein
MAFAGLRPQVLGDLRGEKGLEIRDFPEMHMEDGDVSFPVIPMQINVRSELSKAGHKYFTFLPNEGCEYLKAYLERRTAEGEELSPHSAVIAVKSGYEETGLRAERRRSGHITTKTVTKEIRDAMRPRFTWRPYVLRAYFNTQILLAESHGKITHPYRVFFMGHKGDIEARYSTNKGRLPENLIEDMRSAFAASREYLETTPQPMRDKKEMLLEMWREQAKMYGIDPITVRIEKEKELGKELSLDEEQDLLTREIKKVMMPQLSNNSGKPYRSRIIVEEELVPHVEEGWEIVKELSNGRFLIKKSNHTLNTGGGI